MAVVAQANVVQLRCAALKRKGCPPSIAQAGPPPPGVVRAFRDALIDFRRIRDYNDAELQLRLHEVWGQFCLFCWLFEATDPNRPPDFASTTDPEPLRCGGALEVKTLEIEGTLWRLRYEQQRRCEPLVADDGSAVQARALAAHIPAKVFGVDVTEATDAMLLACSCEHAGMLAAIRWAADEHWTWSDERLMAVDERRLFRAIFGRTDRTEEESAD